MPSKDRPLDLDEIRYFSTGEPMFYGLDGKACSLQEYSDLFRDIARRTVGRNEWDSGWWVSTVFLGVNLGIGTNPPVLWESVVWEPDGGIATMVRYDSREKAEAGHRVLVLQVESQQGPFAREGEAALAQFLIEPENDADDV